MFSRDEEELLEALKKAMTPTLAATAEAMLWRTWCRSGNTEADRIFRAGVDAMQQNKLEDAAAEFSRGSSTLLQTSRKVGTSAPRCVS